MADRYTIPQLVFQALCGAPIYSHEGFIAAEERVYGTRWVCDVCLFAWQPPREAIKIEWQYEMFKRYTPGMREDTLRASTYCPRCGVKTNLRLATNEIQAAF